MPLITEKLGGVSVGAVCPIELPDLKGRENLAAYNVPLFSVVSFVGE
jgi:adenine/guanine phosphoribosyltransferase-like PRPP-binding protein